MKVEQLALPMPVRLGARVGRPLRGSDFGAVGAMVLAAVLALLWAFAATPPFKWNDLGKPKNATVRQQLYLHDFHAAENDANDPAFATKRWSKPQSEIVFAGLGRGVWDAGLVLSGYRPAGPPATLTLTGGTQQTTLQLATQARHYHVLMPVPQGDVTIKFTTTGFTPQQFDPRTTDDRELGVILNDVTLQAVALSALPPTSTLVWVLLTLAVLYLALRLSNVPARWAVIAPLALALILAVALHGERLALGLFLPRLFGGAVAGLLGVGVARWVWPRMLRFGRLEAPPWLLPALLVVFLVGYFVKLAGVLFPYTITIDVPWHMDRTRDILNGQLAEMYRPGAFSRSVMPLQEWGTHPPVIPYSPFFHIFATAFAVFPWRLELTANVFSVLVDTSRTFLIAALALCFGLRARVALLAVLLYAITPFTFLLHSWGNIPTTFGMWWTLVATTVIALGYNRLRERKVWLFLAVVLLLTLLFYTVMGVFTGVFVVLFMVAMLVWGRGAERRSTWALGAAFAVAVVLSLLIYYGQYIGPIIQQTLPYINNTVVAGQQTEGQSVISPWGEYLYNFVVYSTNYDKYGLWLPFIVGVPGVWLLRRNRLALITVGAWIIVAVLFFAVGTRVSMVDKHTFYVTPALCITTAAVFDWAWQRWRWTGAVVALTYGATAAAALWVWLDRLTRVAI